MKIVNKLLESLKNASRVFCSECHTSTYLDNLPYNSLSPMQNADEDDSYINALSWAIQNRKSGDIKNIALAGPFGSGKSSVLKTFQFRNKNKDLFFLNISLANFKFSESQSNESSDSLPRLIELSILQQIFYHEKDKNIPDSRFRKIRSFKTKDLLGKTFLAIIFIFSIINLFFHNILENCIVNIGLDFPKYIWISILSVFVIIFCLIIIVYNSVRAIHSIKISKFKITDTEIEIGKNINKSILNHHLDEILYFFEITKYNVVIIEDLDRFGKAEIFIKLREINHLINNSKKIDKDVVFIYAIRDDMFLDEERTKFFDFVIPIIPVVNSSNSNEILLNYKRKYNFNISERLIDDISLFIDDMRLLINIVNEYYIYHLKLDKKLDQDKILSLIVYKNMFPNDFVKLGKNEGDLFKILSLKRDYVNTELSNIDNHILVLENEIKELNKLKIKDVNELRSIYLFRYLCKISNLQSFVINNVNITPESMLKDDYFNLLTNNKVVNIMVSDPGHNSGYPYTSTNSIKFESIEAEIDESESYQTRFNNILKWHDNYANKIAKDIENLKNSKHDVKLLPISSLVKNMSDYSYMQSKQDMLINVLLRNGYINEDYLDYMSIFYEGTLSKNDYEYLLNVKINVESDFNLKISNVEKIISKMNLNDFKNACVLNYKLIDYIINNELNLHKSNVFILLSDESKRSIEFIDGFIYSYNNNISLFFMNLCTYWANIWNYIYNYSNYTIEKQYYYLNLILRYSNISDIVKISSNSNLFDVIARKSDLSYFIDDNKRTIDIIKLLNVKFDDIDFKKTSSEVLDFIYQESYYNLKIEIIENIITYYGNNNLSKFYLCNYSSILSSDCNDLIKYIHTNINEYIANVYLMIESNNQEDEDNYIKLLLNENISIENVNQIIVKILTKISDVSQLQNQKVVDLLLQNNKMHPTWKNVFYCYELNSNNFSDSLTYYLSQNINSSQLSKSKISVDDEKSNEIRYRTFIMNLINLENLDDFNYGNLIKSIPYIYNSLDLSNISSPKVELLIANKILNLTPANFSSLKSYHNIFLVTLICMHKSKFLKSIDDYDIDDVVLNTLIYSDEFDNNEKTLLLNYYENTFIDYSIPILNKIGELLISVPSFSVSTSTLLKVLTVNTIHTSIRISIFILMYNQLEVDSITTFLNSLGEPYSKIAVNGKNPLIPKTKENIELIFILKRINYISNYNSEYNNGIRVFTYKH